MISSVSMGSISEVATPDLSIKTHDCISFPKQERLQPRLSLPPSVWRTQVRERKEAEGTLISKAT